MGSEVAGHAVIRLGIGRTMRQRVEFREGCERAGRDAAGEFGCSLHVPMRSALDGYASFPSSTAKSE